jgi:signal transduction histidine kinase
MKKRLTLQFLFWNIIILYIVQFVFFGVNIISMRSGLAFSKGFYNFTFAPAPFCESYIEKLSVSNEGFNLEQEDSKVITDNEIWLQVLDASNKEIYSLNKPTEIPPEYLAAELIQYSKNGWSMPKASTIYAKTFEKEGKRYSLIVGFPIAKVFTYTLRFTQDDIKFFKGLIVLTFLLTLGAGYLFSRKLASPMADIVEDINFLAKGKYELRKKKKSALYRNVDENIIKLGQVLKQTEEERKDIEKQKEEWIANIAHDLKTPLASVKGYSQLLEADDYELSSEDVKRYAGIINGKTDYIEELIKDLSLIYKFKNKVVPMNMKRENLVEVLKDTVIDILNTPAYAEKEINMDYEEDSEVYFQCDKLYFKRALTNFIVNAIIHNPKDTKIYISLFSQKNNEIYIEIRDDGRGINEDELKSLFNRYYRSSNTEKDTEGSGLGMAISKEIIEYHEGRIEVSSKVSEGTSIKITLKAIT